MTPFGSLLSALYLRGLSALRYSASVARTSMWMFRFAAVFLIALISSLSGIIALTEGASRTITEHPLGMLRHAASIDVNALLRARIQSGKRA